MGETVVCKKKKKKVVRPQFEVISDKSSAIFGNLTTPLKNLSLMCYYANQRIG